MSCTPPVLNLGALPGAIRDSNQGYLHLTVTIKVPWWALCYVFGTVFYATKDARENFGTEVERRSVLIELTGIS